MTMAAVKEFNVHFFPSTGNTTKGDLIRYITIFGIRLLISSVGRFQTNLCFSALLFSNQNLTLMKDKKNEFHKQNSSSFFRTLK